MEDKIYICELECDLKASQKQRDKVNPKWEFDLTKLPTEGMRIEFRQFILDRGKMMALSTVVSERNLYNRICRFMEEKNIRVDSFQEKTLEEWLKIQMERGLFELHSFGYFTECVYHIS